MSIRSYRADFVSAICIILVFTAACNTASKPAPPKAGTLAHSWMTAEQAYKAGDYKKANEHLARLATARSEYRDRAKLWSFIVTTGVANGYRELADAYETAARSNKALAADYFKRVSYARRAASQSAMMAVENLHDFMKDNKDPKVAFDFEFPSGKSSEPIQLTRLSKGFALQPADHDVLERAMLERGVVQVASEVGGAPGDPEKAKAQFKQPSKASFMYAMAHVLYDTANLYAPKKLDEPKRMHILCNEALAALAAAPDSQDRKQIEAKIRDLLKKHPLKA
jgi:hypothetical protein